jgi:hypothetical protein
MVPNAFRNLVKRSYILASINIVPILLCVRDGHQSSIALISCKFVWMLKQLGWIHTHQFALCTIVVDFGGQLLIMHPNTGTSCLHFQKHCPRR